jgi:hypothetical protein
VSVGTNVPNITWSNTGFTIPSGPAVLAGVQADISAAFVQPLNFNLNTPQGQIASSEAATISNVYALFQYYTQQVDPAYASGRMQDGLGRIYFLERNPAEPTVLQIICFGLPSAVIPIGSLITDQAQNLYAAQGSGTIAANGSVTMGFACTAPGPVAVPASDAVSIYQSVSGWDSVAVASGVQGQNTESRQAFELRRQDSVAGNSFGAAGSILGAVAKVAGVTDYYAYDNSSNGSVTISGVEIAPNSIYVCAAGGAPADIAFAIWSKKGAGCSYTGTTTEIVTDPNPLYNQPPSYDVSFTIAKPLQLLFNVVLVFSLNVPANANQLVQQALINAVAQGIITSNPQVIPGLRARIANTVYANTYIQAINALGSWAQVASIGIGSANSPGAVVSGSIGGNNFTVTDVISGTISVGQTLSDASGVILVGTQITGFVSGTLGGPGVYTVNQPQTISAEQITLASANQSFVTVQADQEPQLSAANIVVGVT